MLMAAGSSLSGRAPCPCLLRHRTQTQAEADTYKQHTHIHAARSHVQRGPPYSSDEKGCSVHPPPPPPTRLSQSETAPQVRWSDFCHFRLDSKDLMLAHKTLRRDDAGAVCVQLIQCLRVDSIRCNMPALLSTMVRDD